MDELKSAVKEILIAYLPDEAGNPILDTLVNRAVQSYQNYVNYPPDMEETDIESDMKDNLYCISDLALYAFNKQGADFESMHNENGVSRTYEDKGSIFIAHGVFPYVRV